MRFLTTGACAQISSRPLLESARRAGTDQRTGDVVTLTDAGGAVLESGAAVETPAGSGRWVYTATAAAPTGTDVRIAVQATDMPGGVGAQEVEKTV